MCEVVHYLVTRTLSTLVYMGRKSSVTSEIIHMYLLCDFKSEVNAAESSRQIYFTLDSSAVFKSTEQTWLKYFRDDDNNNENWSHSRRLSQMSKE